MDNQAALYERLMSIKNKLFRVALTMLKTEDDAMDAVQDTYLKLWSQRNNFQNWATPEAFAMKMLKNLCIDRLRKTKKINQVNISTQFDISDNITPFQSLSFENLRELMLKLFDTLPEPQRLIIHLRDIEHYSYEEIQEITGLTINNIRVTLARARQNVRSSYQKIKNYENRRN